MRLIFAVIMSVMTFISCSTDLDKYQGYSLDYRDKSYSDVKHVGATCNHGCVYSKYAVEYNIQEKQYDCVEGPCSCVRLNDVYSLCQEQDSVHILPEQESVTNNSHNQTINVPYYNQYDNQHHPSATCQNTSIAMLLSYYQYRISPDEIYLRWGKDIAQSPSGLNFVYTHYSSNSTISTYTNATPEDLINGLRSGYIAIVHGYFTTFGHVMVVKSFDGEFYYVNDPAGDWEECFKCGYKGSYNGKTKYNKQAFENAVFTSDGYSYLPGWIHLVKER